MNLIDALQWPAMLLTILSAWLVGSLDRRRREIGFYVFLASNVLWVAWGVHARAWALVMMQFALAAMNLRGVRRND